MYKETIDSEESQWWFDLAKREYFFKEDRKKEYKKELPDVEIPNEASVKED